MNDQDEARLRKDCERSADLVRQTLELHPPKSVLGVMIPAHRAGLWRRIRVERHQVDALSRDTLIDAIYKMALEYLGQLT